MQIAPWLVQNMRRFRGSILSPKPPQLWRTRKSDCSSVSLNPYIALIKRSRRLTIPRLTNWSEKYPLPDDEVPHLTIAVKSYVYASSKKRTISGIYWKTQDYFSPLIPEICINTNKMNNRKEKVRKLYKFLVVWFNYFDCYTVFCYSREIKQHLIVHIDSVPVQSSPFRQCITATLLCHFAYWPPTYLPSVLAQRIDLADIESISHWEKSLTSRTRLKKSILQFVNICFVRKSRTKSKK